MNSKVVDKLDVCNFPPEDDVITDIFKPPDSLYFIITSPDFTEGSGGITVLHRLCDLLNTVFSAKRALPLCFLLPGKLVKSYYLYNYVSFVL